MGVPLFIPVQKECELVIATDNAGAIGSKSEDQVQVPYSIVAEALFRVAFMDAVAVGASPYAVNVMNFAGDDVWLELEETITEQCRSLGFKLSITGSTESNFSMNQSAIGLSVIGTVSEEEKKIGCSNEGCGVALIGEPLVGEEVIHEADKIAPLDLFLRLTKQDWVHEILPVGSKGIEGSLIELEKRNGWNPQEWIVPFDRKKSGGPSTSFLITYDLKRGLDLQKQAGRYLTVLG
ncbi:ATPase [Halobacillus sp. B23F22_1]|uniref:ATPase n=1 Tax=Halobacillus sp. B23F22_1 TaxID=3459514 RepID=UPI00373FB9E1